jgi:TonB family protein
MRKASNNKYRAITFLLLVICSRQAMPDDEEPVTRHLTDSSTDRTPAVTAFPKYPSIARRDRIEGEAIVCFLIDVHGKIVRPSVRSSSHRIFEKPALRAIRDSSFEPLSPGDTLEKSRTCRTYRFRLDPVTADNDEPPPPRGL